MPHLLLLDVAPHARDPHAVGVPQVVPYVELIEVERHLERGKGGRELWGAEEDECEVGSDGDR